MSSLSCLKGKDEYRVISITHDYNIGERNSVRAHVKEAKEKNEMEPINSAYVWKVRGTPKNGVRVIKLLKRQPP